MLSTAFAGPAVVRLALPPSTRRPWRTGAAPFTVEELSPRYEDEGSEARSRGSVSVAPGAWWSATLSVPGSASEPARGAVLLRVERHGTAPDQQPVDAAVELVLPSTEIDAVVTLLAGVVAQARRDEVLPAAG